MTKLVYTWVLQREDPEGSYILGRFDKRYKAIENLHRNIEKDKIRGRDWQVYPIDKNYICYKRGSEYLNVTRCHK